MLGSLTQLTTQGPLPPSINHFSREISPALPGYPNQNISLNPSFQNHLHPSRFLPNAYVRDQINMPQSFRGETSEKKYNRRPSIEKKLEVPSTKENFTKSSKKPFLNLNQESFEKLPQSNHSLKMDSISFPNLDEMNNMHGKGNSFLEIKPRSPNASKNNYGSGFFNGALYGIGPSIANFMQPSMDHDIKAFQFPNCKNNEKQSYHESNIPTKKNLLSFTNLEVAKNIPSDYAKQITNKDYPFKINISHNDKKFPFSGRFTSMNRIDSNKELESIPVLGKRDKPESQIRLESLTDNLDKLKPPVLNKASEVDKGSQTKVNLDTRVVENEKEKLLKPNSTTSLESNGIGSTF
jgi:hypothetical protein